MKREEKLATRANFIAGTASGLALACTLMEDMKTSHKLIIAGGLLTIAFILARKSDSIREQTSSGADGDGEFKKGKYEKAW